MRASFLKPAIGLLFAAALVSQPEVAAAQIRSTLDGVYTDEQARRGAQLNRDVCSECHYDEDFTDVLMMSWAEAPANALYQVISTQMPEDNPGSLAPEQYADILAYIFKVNGMPPGPKALEPTDEVLRNIIIRQKQ
ncbi:MAG: hypothetical protein O7I93_10910 [Gemmatimonadetes bacterium]|nr:hypothetical protein [Gemmatimonadota bacterium]